MSPFYSCFDIFGQFGISLSWPFSGWHHCNPHLYTSHTNFRQEIIPAASSVPLSSWVRQQEVREQWEAKSESVVLHPSTCGCDRRHGSAALVNSRPVILPRCSIRCASSSSPTIVSLLCSLPEWAARLPPAHARFQRLRLRRASLWTDWKNPSLFMSWCRVSLIVWIFWHLFFTSLLLLFSVCVLCVSVTHFLFYFGNACAVFPSSCFTAFLLSL